MSSSTPSLFTDVMRRWNVSSRGWTVMGTRTVRTARMSGIVVCGWAPALNNCLPMRIWKIDQVYVFDFLYAADINDSTFWDHLFRKRPAARSDDLELDECGKKTIFRWLWFDWSGDGRLSPTDGELFVFLGVWEVCVEFSWHFSLTVWIELNNTCACRAEELHCQHRQLKRLPGDLPNDGIELLWVEWPDVWSGVVCCKLNRWFVFLTAIWQETNFRCLTMGFSSTCQPSLLCK